MQEFTIYKTLEEVSEAFDSEEKCREYLINIRWPNGKIVCPRCKRSTNISALKSRPIWWCGGCGRQFGIRLGTIFNDHISLQKWFLAVWLVTTHYEDISSRQLANAIKVNKDRAWKMLRRLRESMSMSGDNVCQIGGVNIIDQSFVGKERLVKSAKNIPELELRMPTVNYDEKPNLFNFATSELSQDAVICWLLQFSDSKYADFGDLHDCGRQFVNAMLEKHGCQDLPSEIETEIRRQDQYIDVLAKLGPAHVLLIESKTVTSVHGNQLNRYYESLRLGNTKLGHIPENAIYPILFKTGDQSLAEDRSIENNVDAPRRPYKVFNRTDVLKVLSPYCSSSEILSDYFNYLKRWESDSYRFRKWQISERDRWPLESWEGFFRFLEDKLEPRAPDSVGWGYVPNPAGGFRGFWWGSIDLGETHHGALVYLQLEIVPNDPPSQNLCFKVDVSNETAYQFRYDLKYEWSDRLIMAGDGRTVRPPRLRVGKTMTVAHWASDWLAFQEDGLIDIDSTIQNLKEAEKVLNRAVHL